MRPERVWWVLLAATVAAVALEGALLALHLAGLVAGCAS